MRVLVGSESRTYHGHRLSGKCSEWSTSDWPWLDASSAVVDQSALVPLGSVEHTRMSE